MKQQRSATEAPAAWALALCGPKCRRCGERGHKTRDCKTPKASPVVCERPSFTAPVVREPVARPARSAEDATAVARHRATGPGFLLWPDALTFDAFATKLREAWP